MSRLIHSRNGYHRYMQMSRARAFVFVEGKTNDPYFYGKFCESVFHPTGIIYQIVRAQELPGGTGGKQSLDNFFLFLRRRKELISNFKGKTTGTVFFFDKDVDDLLRKQRRSGHVVYTQHYDIENHLFAEGDLGEAGAAASSLDGYSMKTGLGNYENWRRRAAEAWKEWVKLCLFARKKNINCECTYSLSSRINNPLYGPVDPTAHAFHLNILKAGSGLSDQQFSEAFRRVSRLVDELYARGDHDRVFKGKWYSSFLDAEIRSIAGARPINSNGLVNRLISAIALTVDYNRPWAENFKEPLRNLSRRL